MDDIPLLIIFLIILIFMSAFFSSSETAFSSLNRIRMKNYSDSGNKKAKKVLTVSNNYNSLISAVLICNTIVNTASASIATVIFTRFFGDLGPGISTVVLTLFLLTFGEVIPKSYAKYNSEKLAMNSAHIIGMTMIILKPFIALFSKISEFLAKRSKFNNNIPSVTEEELKYIIEAIEDEGVLEKGESELVQSALDFDDILAEEILTPRVDIVAVEINSDAENIKNLFLTERFSRIPVYKKSIDNIVGVLNEKDFFRSYLVDNNVDISLIMQKTFFIPPKIKISELLKQLQHKKSHMAVVTDPYGGVLGILTMEDILEELIGEIWDENDEIVTEIFKIDDNTYRVNGDMNIEKMLEEIGYDIKNFETESNTVSGWVLEILEKIPAKGEAFNFENLTVEVNELDDQRIISLIVTVNKNTK